MPWKAKDAASHVKGLTEAQSKKWATIANAALSACEKRGGTGCDAYALRVASTRVSGKAEESDREWMRGHLGDALRELSTGPLSGKEKQGEHARLLGAARLFNLTESTLSDIEQAQDVDLCEFADLHESDGVTWDAENGVARNIKIHGMSSANGYDYSDPAANDVARLAENIPIFQNHPETKTQSRKQQDAAGFIRGVRRVPDGSRGDWYVPPRLHEEVKWAIENNAPGSGMSINAQGKMRGRGKGRRGLVENVIRMRSIDYVAHPATTNSLRESTKEPGDGLGIEKVSTVIESTGGMELSTMELKEVTDRLDAVTSQLSKVQESLGKAEKRADKAEADAKRIRMVTEAIEESGKTVKATFRAILERCETKEEMAGALAELPAAKAGTNPPTANGVMKPIAEGKDKTKKIDAAVKGLFESTKTRVAPGMVILGEAKKEVA